MGSPIRALDCPDPHDLRPTLDPMLQVLEGRLVTEFRIQAAFPERGQEMDAALHAYVEYLHILGCSPEHVVLHVKRRLADATSDLDATRAKAAREAIILRAIKVYFGAP